MALADVKNKDENKLWARLNGDGDTHLKPPLPHGAMVRISKHKGVFDKGYMPNWSKEHFNISEAPQVKRGTRRRVYKIQDYNGEPVKGFWYPEELQQITDNQYRIERVLRRRKAANGSTELFVKWEWWPEKFNSWTKQTDTMSLGNEFQVAVPRNVNGPTSNTPDAYETTLAHPLDFPGTWEVGLIDITFPHTWLNLNNEIVVGISLAFLDDDIQEENENIIGEENSMDLVKALKNVGSFYRKQVIQRYRETDGRMKNRYFKVRVDFKVRKTFGIIQINISLKIYWRSYRLKYAALDLGYKTLECFMIGRLIELQLLEINKNS